MKRTQTMYTDRIYATFQYQIEEWLRSRTARSFSGFMRAVARCLQQRLFRQFTTLPPNWWQQGWSRQRAGSVAEAELLAPLAQLLMPQTLPLELFRSFPSPPGWLGNYLEPDLAAHGVLKDPEAALFVEYDGYWRHGEKEGIEMDQLKNAALLAFAPDGSKVIRISHTASKPVSCDANILWVCVDPWRQGCQRAFMITFNHLLSQMVDRLQSALNQEMLRKLQRQRGRDVLHLEADSKSIVDAAMKTKGRSTREEISLFLHGQGFTAIHISMMLESQLSAGQSIDNNLKPKLQWLSQLGLSKSQVAKAVAAFPKVLGYRIERNLKPTVQWLLDFGLNKTQVAKAVATNPAILGYSIEQNLKPTVQWLQDLGLSQTQVAKAVATFPAILGCSVEQNLKPTVQWLLDLGLNKTQVAKALATSPAILGYSIEQNLKPTVHWLQDLGLSQTQVAKAVATFPAILGCSVEQNLKPTVQWLLDLGLNKTQVAKALATNPTMLGLSTEKNLKPTVQWLLDLGLSQTQVAKVVATSPPILGLSIEKNCKPKYILLVGAFGPDYSAQLIARFPPILGYSHDRLAWRLSVLAGQNETRKLASAMSLTPDAFQKRFLCD